MAMGNAERFTRLFNGEKVDRTPVIEWATWWDQTTENWFNNGLPRMNNEELCNYWGHDRLKQFWLPTRDEGCPKPAYHGGPLMEDEDDYHALKKHLYTNQLLDRIDHDVRSYAELHKGEDIAYWFSLDGFFWFPRTLFGIEGHLYAFYDYPDLMLEINSDLTEYHKKCLEVLYQYIQPQFMTLAEDMSYNHGPMLSKQLYDRFMLPFYKELTPLIRQRGTRVLIDSDGQVEPLIPWFLEGGIEGILPLERMAGVDVNRLRANYPEFIMIGGYDKTVMHKGEAAIRAEFERILPAIRSGRYIPSVDHQTPPAVSIEDYRLFVKILWEYAAKAGDAKSEDFASGE